MPASPPAAAAEHYAVSAALALRGAQAARNAAPRGLLAVVQTIIRHQAAQAALSQAAVGSMLDEQGITVAADALLNTLAFTTETDRLLAMIDATSVDAEFDRLVESLIQEAGRAAESVAVTVRPKVQFVRYLNLPSCSRCAVLAGRVYRYSEGFQRHPNCDCVMLPVTVASPNYVQDPADLAAQGLVTGLSKADLRALSDGADFGRIVNTRRTGLRQAGQSLGRRGRPTPASIYATTSTREEAVKALAAAGYLL